MSVNYLARIRSLESLVYKLDCRLIYKSPTPKCLRVELILHCVCTSNLLRR